MSTPSLRVGLVGCGAISGAYLKFSRQFPVLEIAACADLDLDRARAKAAEFHVARACSVDELLHDPAIDLILNLTPPAAHAEISLRALEAGKHVYSEKPLATTLTDGQRLLALAREKHLRVGCAPDTVLGSGIQTARKLIEDSAIGRPVAFTAFMMNRGHESWHPAPQFFYAPGGGPLFDMGPYYLTALLTFFGPLARVGAMASVAIPQRIITSQPHAGQRIEVQTPDHLCATLEYRSGVIGTLITSFATWHPSYDEQQPITVYGSEGTLRVSDPNLFDGPVSLRRAEEPEWRLIAPLFPTGQGRSIGLADMAGAIGTGAPHRCSGEVALAVLEAMEAALLSSREGRFIEMPVPGGE